MDRQRRLAAAGNLDRRMDRGVMKRHGADGRDKALRPVCGASSN
jgi:hypothetical protein